MSHTVNDPLNTTPQCCNSTLMGPNLHGKELNTEIQIIMERR